MISPVTTLVAELVENGQSLGEAETNVKNVLGLNNNLDLSSFDPFGSGNSSTSQAMDYKILATKIANIFMSGDGDLRTIQLQNTTQLWRILFP